MKLKCDNKECTSYGIVESFPIVRIKLINGEIEYHFNGERVVCTECNIPLVESKSAFKGFGVFRGAFADKSPEQKREILKKRERAYYKKDKNAQDYKKYKDNGGTE